MCLECESKVFTIHLTATLCSLFIATGEFFVSNIFHAFNHF